ncbi:S8 family serine peptidase [uncultured Microbacterium sp.]|uniref:S8 family serine peptidase n=1 Tax=uncultured Microbacterium sp. TaxID=191216 RepID=UPI0028D1C04F|nr:S8 family serine peptidase [uncultured Microbacterium sp.]
MGRRATRIAACVALAALVSGGFGAGAAYAGPRGASASDAPAPSPVGGAIAPVPVASSTGTYIVVLDGDPVVAYRGGERGFAGTAAADGELFDPHATRAERYAAFLQSRQKQVAEEAGVEPLATYQTVLNGFSAKLTPDAAARVAGTAGVLALYPEEIFRPDGVSSASHARAAVASGVSPAAAAPGSGGDGVVVGTIDTGIEPDSPSFAGDRLTTSRAARVYLAGSTVVVPKADGRQFRSERVSDDDWTRSEYSTKLVGAQYFSAGAEAAGFDLAHDVLSPRDADGHGSRVAGIAAGNTAVDAEIDGTAFGSVSGAAPDARIASYKACYVGRDPLSSADDLCAGTDVLAALDRAVSDGVDVISFSLGAEQPGQDFGAVDLALYGAAQAGVSVAVSAGNAGPAPGTGHGGAPWYTTVAASTSTGFAATVRLADGFEAPGVSASVSADAPITAPIVFAGDAAKDGSADAHLCYEGTLDPAVVQGAIVVCDRGTNPRDEKAREVRDAGGVGMVLVNVADGSLDAELDAVPTVHIGAAERAALLAAVQSGTTASLSAVDDGNAPAQIAGFSGRGPTVRGDVLTPDVAAPGVAVLAPSVDASTGAPTWALSSGTSMAAPAVAGLAAAYLAAHPGAMPDEIKSALMTTAGDAVEGDAGFAADPFAQGAGSVDAARALDPGLLYLSGPAQWQRYLQDGGHGPRPPTESAAEPAGELNLPSIAIPELGPTHTVTRTLTAARAGTYEVAASIPGVEVSVSPSVLTFAAAGDTQTYTVTFENDSAPAGLWATGFLVWTEADGTWVRSPLAVRPAAASPTPVAAGVGVEGTAVAQVVSGSTGEITLDGAGLARVDLLVDPDEPVQGHSGDGDSGDANGRIAWTVPVPEGARLAEFALAASADGPRLTVYRLAQPEAETDGQVYAARFDAENADGLDRVTLVDPEPGSYLVVVDLAAASDHSVWDLTSAVVDTSSRSLSVAAESTTATAGETMPFTLSWTGLDPGADYVGVVAYGQTPARTLVRVSAGAAAPAADAPPVISGDAVIGGLLRVESPEWDADEVSISYQWLRDGEPIEAADEREYRVRGVDAGTSLTAQVTAVERGNINAGVAVSAPLIVETRSTVAVTMNRSTGSVTDRYTATVVVTADGLPATGTVTVRVDGTAYVGTLAGGRVTFVLPAPTRGTHLVVADYSGSRGVAASDGETEFAVGD